MLRELITIILVVGSSVALIIVGSYITMAAECEAYGEVTGRKVVYNWGCYAADDDGRMVPAGQIDRLTVTTK